VKFSQRTPPLDNPDHQQLRAQIRDYFHHTFSLYESLFETLNCDQAYYQKPITLRHPLIFYLGHTATFFMNKLMLAGLIRERVNPQLESLFAVGVDEMSWDDIRDDHYPWPSVTEVKAYRAQVRQVVDQLLQDLPLHSAIDWQHPWWPIVMGIEHERIHLETSSVLIRQQKIELVQPQAAWPICSQQNDAAPKNQLMDVPAGKVQLHKKHNDRYYGWDNEYGEHHAEVAAFQTSQYLVSNQEFLSFVDAGGYQEDCFWQAEGLAWKQYAKAQHPSFWRQKNQQWFLRLMTEEIPMPWSWPVEVNYHEAKAFCEWQSQCTGKSIRLPTEDEWYRLYAVSGVGSETQANLHLEKFASPCPVSACAQGDFYDVIGNVWQWTETPIYPFHGFDVHPLYDDFTTPTFDGQHNLIKGGSWISTGNETLPSARYAFRRHFFQHAGFRYVNSEAPVKNDNIFYESDQQLSEYAEFHYGDEYYGVANFPKALVDLALPHLQKQPLVKALDLGCATGRASFELASYFQHVIGIDFSARFINLCTQMREQGEIRYSLIDEGKLVSYRTCRLADVALEKTAHSVEFFQGDACNLKANLSDFDFILAANLIDRLYQPAEFLDGIHQRLKLGGVLMITSPYTWLEAHTQPENWLGGFKKDGENFTTLDALKQHLSPHFALLQSPQDVPFVIRETKRKFQHSLSEVTLWQRLR
jgi:SAM-dependent methyltransferase